MNRPIGPINPSNNSMTAFIPINGHNQIGVPTGAGALSQVEAVSQT
jgi:hypothetical protein